MLGVCACLIAAPLVARAQVGAIFMYHHVSPTVQRGPYAFSLTVSPREFERQLEWLRGHGCQVVSVDGIWEDAVHRSLARCEVALTFDDGYEDVVSQAEPLLRRFGFAATLYVATGYVGTSGHMTAAQLRAASTGGFQIGAHTIHHVDLTKIPPAAAQREIDGSQASLQRWLGAAVDTFAYPSGQENPAVVRMVKACGMRTAVTTQAGMVDADDNALALPRYRILRGQGTALLARVFGTQGIESRTELRHIARARVEGNDERAAESVAVALLSRAFPESFLKVHVIAVPPYAVAGIVLSGAKFHRRLDPARFAGDVRQMVVVAFAAVPTLDEVDVWATLPVAVGEHATVSGDYAVPTAKTVFSAAVTRAVVKSSAKWSLTGAYWDAGWRSSLGAQATAQ